MVDDFQEKGESVAISNDDRSIENQHSLPSQHNVGNTPSAVVKIQPHGRFWRQGVGPCHSEPPGRSLAGRAPGITDDPRLLRFLHPAGWEAGRVSARPPAEDEAEAGVAGAEVRVAHVLHHDRMRPLRQSVRQHQYRHAARVSRVPRSMPSIMKVTDPVGVPLPGGTGAIVAVSVSDWFASGVERVRFAVVALLVTVWPAARCASQPVKFASPS